MSTPAMNAGEFQCGRRRRFPISATIRSVVVVVNVSIDPKRRRS
jgi:hypothetical protein